jgi:AraC-like DNA-binding protein
LPNAHPRPWHRGSLHCDGPRRPLTPDQRRAWLARAELERRAGRLTALHVEVGRALLRRLGESGQCDPSQATLAADVGCSDRTVRRALAAMREAGLLTWQRRLACRPWPAGGRGAVRAEQASNAYELLLPTGPVSTRQVPRPRPNCGGQAGRETSLRVIPRQPSLEPLAFDPAAKKALEEIAAARMAAITRAWAGRSDLQRRM